MLGDEQLCDNSALPNDVSVAKSGRGLVSYAVKQRFSHNEGEKGHVLVELTNAACIAVNRDLATLCAL